MNISRLPHTESNILDNCFTSSHLEVKLFIKIIYNGLFQIRLEFNFTLLPPILKHNSRKYFLFCVLLRFEFIFV